MVKTIIFDRNCASWDKNHEFNRAFILNQIGFIYRTMQIQGYIYLDRIYELFGAAWDPSEANTVFKYGEHDPEFSYEHLGGSDFRISICY